MIIFQLYLNLEPRILLLITEVAILALVTHVVAPVTHLGLLVEYQGLLTGQQIGNTWELFVSLYD